MRKTSFGGTSSFFKIIFGLIVLLIIFSVSITLIDQKSVDVVHDCKVLELQQQQLINETTTEIRYLIITDKETFICENSLLNAKFNNTDIFWRLKKDSTYSFKVAGNGKSILFDYRNILEIVK